jgi:hypothetical protein
MKFNPKNCVLGNRLGYCLEEDCHFWSRCLERCQYRQRERTELAALGVGRDKHKENTE